MIKAGYQLITASVIFLGIALCPKKMTTHDHRIFWSQPLRIVLPKTSPAHAALEDLKEDLFYSVPQSNNQKHQVKQLVAGEFNASQLLKYRSVVNSKIKEQPRTFKMATLVVREFKAEPVYVASAYQESHSAESISNSRNNIKGRIELKNGLALWDPNMQLKVRQVVNGQAIAETMGGADGEFSLPTSNTQGTIVAELVNSQNQVYGVGSIPIPTNKQAAVVNIHPSQQGLQSRVVSAISHSGQNFPIEKGTLTILGNGGPMMAEHKVSFVEPMIENGSHMLVQASGEKHNTTMAMGLAGKQWDIAVLPKSMSQAMLNLALEENERYGADDLGMVWGKVTQDGQPVKGARIQISDGADPIYFNELYLPDKKIEGTTENGLFAFVKLNSGIKSVRVFVDDKVVAAQVMPVDLAQVSQLHFDLQGEKALRFTPHVYGVSEKAPALYAQVLGYEEEKDILNDKSAWKIPKSNQPLWVEFAAGPEYERTRQLILPNQENVDVPTFKRSWVDQLLQKNGVQRIPYSATIIGFGPASDFTVEAAGGQVIYLTRDHQVTKQGVPNGAFIISNLKNDIQVVNVIDHQTGMRWIQTVVSEPDITSVMIHPRAE